VRIDLSARLSYADGVQQVKGMLLERARSDSRVLETRAPAVQLRELGDSQVEYVLFAYTSPVDSMHVRAVLKEQIKTWMEQRKLNLPLPQLQVHGHPSLQINQAPPLPVDGQG
jgi:small conductance mechanosensitive channel